MQAKHSGKYIVVVIVVVGILVASLMAERASRSAGADRDSLQSQMTKAAELLTGVPGIAPDQVSRMKARLDQQLGGSQYALLQTGVDDVVLVWRTDGTIAYTNSAGTILLSGPVIDTGNGENLTARHKAWSRLLADYWRRGGGEQVAVVSGESSGTAAAKEHPAAALAADDWGSDGLIPINHQARPAVYSQDSVKAIAKLVINYPGLIESGALTEHSMVASVLTERIPEDRLSAIYRPEGAPIGRITVFTDPTCPNCQQMHEELEDYLSTGYEVRYVLFPRDPANERLAREIDGLHCMPLSDRAAAIDALFAGEAVATTACEAESASAHAVQAAEFYGVTGTPGIFVNGLGLHIPGYAPANELLGYLGHAGGE